MNTQNFKMKYNLHNHTFRCRHASGTEEAYILHAIESGLEVIGFSDHSPMIFGSSHYSGFRMRPEETKDYFDTLLDLREKYRGQIKILIGFEIEYYRNTFENTIKFISDYPLDYFILGQHFIGGEEGDSSCYSGDVGNREDMLVAYVDHVLEACQTGRILYVAHPDLVRYSGPDEIYSREALRLCEGIKALDIPLEINCLGIRDERHYPVNRFLEICGETGVKMLFGADAHSADAVYRESDITRGLRRVDTYGINLIDGGELLTSSRLDPLADIRGSKIQTNA